MPVQALALLILLAALWGGSFVFMRVAAPALGPLPLAFARVALAACVLVVLARFRHSLPPWRTHGGEIALVGLVNSALPFGLFSFAALHVPASVAAILNATSPFFGAIAAAIWLREALGALRVIGMALGFAGVALLVGWQGEPLTANVLLALAACLVASLCYGLASVYTKKRLHDVPSFAVACGSQVAAAAWLAPALPFTTVPGPVTATVVANVVALAVASTAIAYLIYFKLIADVGPSRALTVTFLIPLFGVLWGYLFLGEAVTPGMLVGGALVIVGTALTLRK